MNKKLLKFILLAGLVFVIFTRQSIKGAQKQQLTPDAVLAEVNQWRVERGLSNLEVDQKLCKVALERVEEIKYDWSHGQFNASRACGTEACRVGENLARYYSTPEEVVKAWDASPLHHKVMSEPFYNYACVAQNGTYIVLNLSDVRLK